MSKDYTFPFLFDEVKSMSITDLKKWNYLNLGTYNRGFITWSFRGEKTRSITILVNEDNLGDCVSISSDGNVVAVGAPTNGTYAENSGQVKIFDLSAILSTNDYVRTEFKVYPNPASDEINIQLNNGLELQRVNLYNALGQIVASSNELNIDVSHLNSGLFYIQIVTKNGKIAKKVIIE